MRIQLTLLVLSACVLSAEASAQKPKEVLIIDAKGFADDREGECERSHPGLQRVTPEEVEKQLREAYVLDKAGEGKRLYNLLKDGKAELCTQAEAGALVTAVFNILKEPDLKDDSSRAILELLTPIAEAGKIESQLDTMLDRAIAAPEASASFKARLRAVRAERAFRRSETDPKAAATHAPSK